MNKKIYIAIISIVALSLVGFLAFNKKTENSITSFDKCVKAGGTVASTYPRQCWMVAEGEHFIEQVKGPGGTEAEIIDNNDDTTVIPRNSGVSGTVLLGPTCPGPTRADPPDDSCADKPYETTIQIFAVGGSKSPIATIKTTKEGRFAIMLPPGDYTLQPMGGSVLPSCGIQNITVSPNAILEVNLSCDSGMR